MDVDSSGYGVSNVVHRDVPDWRRDEQSLFRGDARSPDQVRADGGFRPPYETREGWQNQRQVPDIAQHVGGNTNAFVSTSTDRGVAQDFAISGHVYVINAPGGIYTDPTLAERTGKETHGEGEVLFPGGVDWRYVRGWYPMRHESGSGFVPGEFVPNPDYIGDRSSDTSPSTSTPDQPRTDTQRPETQQPHQSQQDSQQHDPRQLQDPPQQSQPQRSQPEQRSQRPGQLGPSTPDASRPAEPTRPGSIADRLAGERPASLGDRMGPLDDPRLDALRPHLRSTEGGMSAFAPPAGADQRQQWNHQNEMFTANQVPRIPGQFVVDMHGSPDSVRIGDTPLSPRDLADVIRANPDYDGGPVSLLGCNTGSRPDGFAAQLAQELGVPVTAPSRDAWVDHNGNVFASSQEYDQDLSKPAKPVWPPNGEWNTYSPNGDQTASRSPYPPGHIPTWTGGDAPARPIGNAAGRGDEQIARQARDARNEQLKALQQDTNQRIEQARREAESSLAEVERTREERLTQIQQDTDRRLAEIEQERATRQADPNADQAAIDAELDQRADEVRQQATEREQATNREADRQADPARQELDQEFADAIAEKDQRRQAIEQAYNDRVGDSEQQQVTATEPRERSTEDTRDAARDDSTRQDDRTRDNENRDSADQAQDGQTRDESSEDQSREDQSNDGQPHDNDSDSRDSQTTEERTTTPEEQSRAPERRDSRSDGRQPWPSDPANGAPIRHRDLDALNLTEQQVDWWRDGRAPLGMDPDQFRRFQSEFADLLRDNGIDPDRAQIRLVGSSVRFYSGWNKTMEGEHGLQHTPESRERADRWQGPDSEGMPERRPFDVQYQLGITTKPSDYDLSIFSDEAVDRARERWGDRDGFAHEQKGFVHKGPMHEALPGLREFQRRWEEKTGRKIGAMMFGLENEPLQRRSPKSNPTDGNWLLDTDARTTPERPERPQDPASGYEITQRDQEFLGYSDEQLQWWHDGDAPLGMTPRQYHDFRASLADALRAEGIDARDVDVRLKGSGVNAFSNPRKTLDDAPHTDDSRARMDEWLGDTDGADRPTSRPFDSMHRLGIGDKSDFDVQIRSDDMVRIARERYEQVPPPPGKDGRVPPFVHEKYGFVDKTMMREQFPELQKWVDHWQRELGRDVEPALFGLDDGPRQESHYDEAKAQRGWPMAGPDASPLGDRPDPVGPDSVGDSARPDNLDDTGPEPPRRPDSEPPADSPVYTDKPDEPPPVAKIDHGDPVTDDDGWHWKGYTLDQETNRLVDEFVPKFREFGHGEDGDGGMRRVMRDIEDRVPNTRLEGVQHDLKGADRLKEKVAERLDRPNNTQTPEQILREIPDAVRYTFNLAQENYTSGLVRIADELRQQGFEEVKRVNSWTRENIPYRGINTRWLDPNTGLRFEVQFHTAESWHVKDNTHDAYEHENNQTLDQSVRDSWNQYQHDYFQTVPIPPAAERVESFDVEKP